MDIQAHEIKIVIWVHRLLRWTLGGIMMASGIIYYNEGSWALIIFGLALIITGFFKPRGCIGGSCEM